MKFKWVIEVEVDEIWVADGFNLTKERAEGIMQKALPYSYSHETAVKIISAPDPKEILIAQGYKE